MAQLDRLHTVCDLASNDSLFMEDDAAGNFYTVLSGALRLLKLRPDGRRRITGFVLPGEFIGPSTSKTHTCNAEALTDASLCCFAIPNFGRIAKENPEMDGQLPAMTNTSLSLA